MSCRRLNIQIITGTYFGGQGAAKLLQPLCMQLLQLLRNALVFFCTIGQETDCFQITCVCLRVLVMADVAPLLTRHEFRDILCGVV